MEKIFEKVVKWSNSYSMGIKLIDDQHKALLNFINDLFNHSSGDEAAERLYFQEAIHGAIQYIQTHFTTEEKLMRATKFPGYAAHKKLHDEFTLTVIQTVNDFEKGKRLVLEKFSYFLKNWVLSHIAVEDRQYSDYIRQIVSLKAGSKTRVTKKDAA